MDIAAISVINSQQQIQSQTDTMLLKKIMDTSTQNADALMRMMGIGGNIDIKI